MVKILRTLRFSFRETRRTKGIELIAMKVTTLTPEVRSKPILAQEIAFTIVHLLPLAAIYTGATFFDWTVCLFFYVYRMFWITGGYHRYFAHKSYKTSRWFQFVIAFMAQTSAQKGALWWAAHHRHHHRHSDTPQDPHSMLIYPRLCIRKIESPVFLPDNIK